MKRPKSHPADQIPVMTRGETEFHVLFNADGGHVQERIVKASCLLECEEIIKRDLPEAVYWEIGF